MKTLHGCLLLGLVLLLSPTVRLSAAPPTPASNRLNLVFILADDLGWSDLGCSGADLIETPHLDRFARQGLRFTQAYSASPVCTPTRASIFTGKHPARLGMTIWSEGALRDLANRRLLPAPAQASLPLSETTLAEHLQNAGYLTALVGKWHLGDADHAPETQGFDINVGGTHWGAPQSFFWPYRGRGRFGQEFRYVPHLEFGQPGEYLTDRLTEEALRILERAAERPFFLYLAHHAPHTPIEAKPADIEHFKNKLRPDMHHQNPTYAAMIKSLDENVGRLLTQLDRRGLTDRTVVIFTSDNGGYVGVDKRSGQAVPVTSNAPLRSGKGSCYEGGLRVPLLVRWPGVTPPGSVCSEPVLLTDWFPTFLEMAGLPLPDHALDGTSLLPLLKDPAQTLPPRPFFFHYPHYYDTTTPVSAVRLGPWKLLEYYEDQHLELFNLQDDPRETNNLASTLPDQARELRQRLDDWRQTVGARLPRPNPDWTPSATSPPR